MTTIMHAEIKMLDGKILYGLGLSSPIFGVGASRAVHEGTIAENPTPRARIDRREWITIVAREHTGIQSSMGDLVHPAVHIHATIR
jgi:hypothetical protein